MDIFILIMIFILGLCVGSFVNMLIYRTAVRYKLVKSLKSKNLNNEKRSVCDFCGRQLVWYENIPVVSWLIQGGKARCCGKQLPYSYPLVELGMGILFVIFNFQLSIINYPISVLSLVVVTFMVFSFVFDLKYMVLPDFSTVILGLVAMAMLFLGKTDVVSYLLSALGGFGFLLMVNLLTRGKGMGMGDVKIAMFMGLFLGWPGILVAFYVAFVVGALVGIFLLLMGKANRKTQIPFGPFLLLGVIVAWGWGEKITQFLIQSF